MHSGFPVRPRLEPIHAFQNAFLDSLGHGWHRVRLVHHGQIVEHALLLLVHPPDAVLDDHCNLIGEGRIVRLKIGDRIGEQMAVAVLVLEAFARQGRATRRPPKQKPAAAAVARRPDQIADALESEHRVEDEKRNGVDAVRGVGRPRRDQG